MKSRVERLNQKACECGAVIKEPSFEISDGFFWIRGESESRGIIKRGNSKGKVVRVEFNEVEDIKMWKRLEIKV